MKKLKLPKVITLEEIKEQIAEVEELTSLGISENQILKPGKTQGIKCMYGGEKFDSMWEAAFYIYTKEKEGKIIERNKTEKLPYIDENGKLRDFYPDFRVAGLLVEVKGILRPTDACKQAQCPHVKFIFGDEIKPMMKWLNEHHPNWERELQRL